MTLSLNLLSLQVGLPQTHTDSQGSWTSGIEKHAVSGPVQAGFNDLAGDGQSDLEHHGGVDKAIYCYPAEHYPAWRSELERPDLPYGAFGENFTTAGLLEAQVCIGDTWRIGRAVVQVSQPRWPCWKLNRLWAIPDLDTRVDASLRCGWYLRVLEPGLVEAGRPFQFIRRTEPQWNIERIYMMAQDLRAYADEALELIAVEALADGWRKAIVSMLSSGLKDA